MGLGKTVQVLAALQQRRLRPLPAAERLPSLVVVPKSLVQRAIWHRTRSVGQSRGCEKMG